MQAPPVAVASCSVSGPLLSSDEGRGEIPDQCALGNGVADLHGRNDRLVGRSKSCSGMLNCDYRGPGHNANEGHLPAADGANEASWAQFEVNASMACAPCLVGHVEPLRYTDGGHRPRPEPGDDEGDDPSHDGSLAG